MSPHNLANCHQVGVNMECALQSNDNENNAENRLENSWFGGQKRDQKYTCPSACLSVYLYLSAYLSMCLSVIQSVYLLSHLFIYLFCCQFFETPSCLQEGGHNKRICTCSYPYTLPLYTVVLSLSRLPHQTLYRGSSSHTILLYIALVISCSLQVTKQSPGAATDC